QTHGLLPGSPAYNAKAGFCTGFGGDTDTITIDQRGQNRDAQCDIGAFEGLSLLTYLPVISR
ncbi:MAG TPA: choice-of-anchor Q domain-containing protein, partial [Anaerolineaceae bacterium]|nr:choice-of-anchor Q domain-containing protein [Anaerolineaceae bacterium]